MTHANVKSEPEFEIDSPDGNQKTTTEHRCIENETSRVRDVLLMNVFLCLQISFINHINFFKKTYYTIS